jgi:RNA polymerase sigma-70 factor (ECF subfamily)
MDETAWLSERFEDHRGHLRAVAYRMLGSLTEADDAVQDAWLRASRSGPSQIENPRWVVDDDRRSGVLNMLRARNVRREQLVDFHVPDPMPREQLQN